MFQVSMFDPKTLSWWFDQADNIDLSPPYQRHGHLWSEPDKAFLIDSILNGYDVPKIYVADFSYGFGTLNASGKQYAVIDGKQRLEAIFQFFESKLRLAPDFVWTDDASASLGGFTYNDMLRDAPKAASRISNFCLSAMRVVTDDETRINELFVRLNRSKPLSGAEIRNAMSGVVPTLIRNIAGHDFFTSRVKFSVNRRQDYNAAAKVLLMEFRGKPVGTQKPNIDRLVEEGARATPRTKASASSGLASGTAGTTAEEDALVEVGVNAEAGIQAFTAAAERCRVQLDRMAAIFVENDPLLSSAGPLTVYYWFVRSIPRTRDRQVRKFLLDFNAERKASVSRAQTGASDVEPDFLAYERFDRSVDNQGSIEARFDILRRRFLR